jgi:23S rRNA (pseudouridine1915-N3)-methyltransferase
MKQIELLVVGDLKFKGLKELEKEYSKKINFFTNFLIKAVKDIRIQDEEIKKKKEGASLLSLIQKNDYVIALNEKGKKKNSLDFSQFISQQLSYGVDRIVFLIGGPAGLSKELDSRINFKLSFSDMTFAHDIFRILFLEQLYRAFTIIKGIKYHR